MKQDAGEMKISRQEKKKKFGYWTKMLNGFMW